MSLPLIPHIRVPVAGAAPCSDPWYTWFQAVQRQVAVSVDVDSLVSEIATKLGSPDGSIAGIPTPSDATGNVLGLKSLQSFGTLAEGQVTMTLRGDVNVPGLTEYYGSNATGQRGWHPVSDTMAQGVGLTLTVGADGVTTFDLADLTDSGTGTFKLITRDAQGRLSGTADGDTDDVPEGAGNLYFTDERAQTAVVAATITDGDTTHAPSGDVVFDALAGKASLLRPQFTDWVGIGKVADRPLTIASDTSTLPAGTAVFLLEGDGNKERIEARSSGGGDPTFQGKASLGTLASPLALASGESLVNLAGSGHNGAEWLIGNKAIIRARATENWTTGGNGCEWVFLNTANGTTGLRFIWAMASSGDLLPQTDNSFNVGSAGLRTKELFCANGTINTSDAREKTAPRDLTDAEIAAAADIARLPCIFQWLHAIEEKGEGARLHCSPTVQSVMTVMESHGLDPFRYGFVCYDEWDEAPEQRDEETGEVTHEYRPAGNRYSLRPNELAHFVMRGLAHRQDELERRLAALEA